MATLAGAVNSSVELWTISADLDDAIDYLQVESEIVRVVGNFPAQYQAPTNTTSAPKIRVERGVGGTTAASHADGTTLTPVIPPALGGGAAEAGTVVAQLTGTETTYGHLYVGDEDPAVDFSAELQPGDKWVDTSDVIGIGAVPVAIEKVRNANNDGWQATGLAVTDGAGNLVGHIALGVDGSILIEALLTSDPQSTIALAADGSIMLAAGMAAVIAEADGTITLQTNVNPANAASAVLGADKSITLSADAGSSTLTMAADGSVEFNGSGVVKVQSLPTADPISVGALWNDAGILKVSAG